MCVRACLRRTCRLVGGGRAYYTVPCSIEWRVGAGCAFLSACARARARAHVCVRRRALRDKEAGGVEEEDQMSAGLGRVLGHHHQVLAAARADARIPSGHRFEKGDVDCHAGCKATR